MTLTLGGAEVGFGNVGQYGIDITDLIQNLDPLIERGVGGLSSSSRDPGRDRIVITTDPDEFDRMTGATRQTSQIRDPATGEFTRDGLTSRLIDGQYTIWYNGNKGTQSLLHELQHPFVKAPNVPNEVREPHSPEFYIGTEEVARGLGMDLRPGWGVKPGTKSATSFETAVGLDGLTRDQVGRLLDLFGRTQEGRDILKRLLGRLEEMGHFNQAEDIREKAGSIDPGMVTEISFDGQLSDGFFGGAGQGAGVVPPGGGLGGTLPGGGGGSDNDDDFGSVGIRLGSDLDGGIGSGSDDSFGDGGSNSGGPGIGGSGGSIYGGSGAGSGGSINGGSGSGNGGAGSGGSLFGGAGTTGLGSPGSISDDDLGGGAGTGGGFVNTGNNPGNLDAYDDQTTGLDLGDDGLDVEPDLGDEGQEVEVDPTCACVPVLLDLDGNGIKVTDLSRSTVFMVGDDGLEHRTAWAGRGDGVLFIDADGDGKISETREYVFTEWDPTARSDFEALRSRFDSNNDGKLTAADARFGEFRVMVTNADGTQTVKTLAGINGPNQQGITEIDLTGDTTEIRLPDGSVITGQSTFTMGGVERTAADVTLMAEAQGYDVRTSAVLTTTTRTTTQTAIDSDGDIAFRIVSVALVDGSQTTNSYDDNGDGQFDRTQRITIAVDGNTRTETTVNKLGSLYDSGVLADRTVETTVTGTAGRVVLTIHRDTVGGGWFNQREVRVTELDGSRTVDIQVLNRDGVVISRTSETYETISASEERRTESVYANSDAVVDQRVTHVLTTGSAGNDTETTEVRNRDNTLVSRMVEAETDNGRGRLVSVDADGDGVMETRTRTDITLGTGDASTSRITVLNADGSLRGYQTVWTSDDARRTITYVDVDGDSTLNASGVVTARNHEVMIETETTIGTAGVRTTDTVVTNTDGSIRSGTHVTLLADGRSGETYVDLDQDGVFAQSEMVRRTTVSDVSISETVLNRTVDGTVTGSTNTVTSLNGLHQLITQDLDGLLNGAGERDYEITVDDLTEVTSTSSTRTIEARNQNGTLRDRTVILVQENGLKTTTSVDRDGNGAFDRITTDRLVDNGATGTVRTITEKSGNGAVTLSSRVIEENLTRTQRTETIDANGDGKTDRVIITTEGTAGVVTQTDESFAPDTVGTVISGTKVVESADGFERTTYVNLNGNASGQGGWESVTTETTIIADNGQRSTTTAVRNGDNALRSNTITAVSDDGFTKSVRTDQDGDGRFERITRESTTFAADGTTSVTTAVFGENETDLLSKTQKQVSGNGLTVDIYQDITGDGTYDRLTHMETVLEDDGDRRETTVVKNLADVNPVNPVESRTVTTTSDDGRSVQTEIDGDGDGDTDVERTVIVGIAGARTTTERQIDATGGLIAAQQAIVSANGLVTTTLTDADGIGGYERRTVGTAVIGTGGVVTRTVTEEYNNGTGFVAVGTTTTTTSDDGLVVTTEQDFDDDGTTDLSTTTSVVLGTGGIETTTVINRSRDEALLDKTVRTVSADKRTVTEDMYLGDDTLTCDRHTEITVGAAGVVRTAIDFKSASGAAESQLLIERSANGLLTTTTLDRDADGRADIITRDETTLENDGTVIRNVTYRNDRFISLGSVGTATSDDGMRVTTTIDLNGDQIIDSRLEDSTTLLSDGRVLRVQEVRNGASDLMASVRTDTAGNGLTLRSWHDFDGDGNIDRSSETIKQDDGSVTTIVNEFQPGLVQTWGAVETVSADGRLTVRDVDTDGDGRFDRHVAVAIDLARVTTRTTETMDENGVVRSSVATIRSANGHVETTNLDVDGSGSIDIIRQAVTQRGTGGNTVTTITETYQSLGQIDETYREIRTVAADGRHSSTTFDVDGNGTTDGTTTWDLTLNADGSRSEVTRTVYANDNLRALVQTETSRDGRVVTTRSDYDGNGIDDKTVVSTTALDGARVTVEASFDRGGMQTGLSTTTVSGDGLVTEIVRGTTVQTIIRSAVNNGSYVWFNGVAATAGGTNIVSHHEIDALGIETWRVDRVGSLLVPYGEWPGNSTAQSSTIEVRLDATAKARIIAEAARIYDTALDRDMDFSEVELLVDYIHNGQLDEASLMTALIAGAEFSTRYGDLDKQGFVTQIYQNSFGRAPSMAELSRALFALGAESAGIENGGLNWPQFAAQISMSAEHLVAGNGHVVTNNFDVILNPAQFERSLDRATVETMVRNLVDAAYDRAATVHELAYFANKLMTGTATPEAVATELLGQNGTIFGMSTRELSALTANADFIEQAFINAIGRQPTAMEQSLWERQFSDGNVTRAAFLVALAFSLEHNATGTTHIERVMTATTVSGTANADTLSATLSNAVIYGGAGNDILNGIAGGQQLVGGTGLDTLNGGAGSDIYVWARNDQNDEIRGGQDSALDTDTLKLTDVDMVKVLLVRNAAGNLEVRILSVNDTTVVNTITILESAVVSNIEVIKFANGEWDRAAIERNIVVLGGDAATTITGRAGNDRIMAQGGADVVNAGAGDDLIVGGTANDTLQGDVGSDIYRWYMTDGNDTITDTGPATTDLDVLELRDVDPANVRLQHLNGTNTLRVTFTNDPARFIDITDRFLATNGQLAGNGIEAIRFVTGAGVVTGMWSLREILERTDYTGGSGTNTLIGTAYGDNLRGGLGADTLDGGAGNDMLYGGAGNDSLTGGTGADTYIWVKPVRQSASDVFEDSDTIIDSGTLAAEVDTLVLRGVTQAMVTISPSGISNALRVIVKDGSDIYTITIRNQFASVGAGIEAIQFGDGSIWTIDELLARNTVFGTSGSDTLTGTSVSEIVSGGAAADTMDGLAGDDRLNGGTGNDLLRGGLGNDQYTWNPSDTPGVNDGADTILDAGSAGDVDSLRLGVSSGDVDLERAGADLRVVVRGVATITIANRFDSLATGNGVEVISFNDGTQITVLDTLDARIVVTGDGTNNTLNGWAYRDVTFGGAGNDTQSGALGNDTLNGGTGDDSLSGGAAAWVGVATNGADTYIWEAGDGSDRILDDAKSRTEIDRLEFGADIDPAMVTLRRLVGSNDLRIRIGDDLLTVVARFENLTFGYGIEEIVFADGTVWQLEDIIARTEMYGDATAADSIAGGAFRDNIFGLGGADTLHGLGGNDVLTGGEGADILRGGSTTAEASNGNDSYVWTMGHGSDTIDDRTTGIGETDQLILTDVESTMAITLVRMQGSNNLQIRLPNGAIITDMGRFADATQGTGIESILFSDGVIWTLGDILAETTSTGTGTVSGTSFRDNLFGGDTTADTLLGFAGDDLIDGGKGADFLSGGGTTAWAEEISNGNDTYVWNRGDGDDIIGDYGQSVVESDRLVLDATSTDVTLARNLRNLTHLGTFGLEIRIAGSDGAVLFSRCQLLDSNRYGIEVIQFSDGTEWTLADIVAKTKTEDIAGATSSLVGTVYRDNIYGLGGNDTLDGGAGSDWLYGGVGADSIVGGADFDTVSYIDSASGVIVNLALTTAQTGAGGEAIGDRLFGIEAVQGSNHADTLYGDNESNDLFGLDENDALVGQDGYDRLYGGNGDDRLIGGIGGDRLVGGAGFDWADYANATLAVNASFANSDLNRGDADGDVYDGVEGLIGSAYNDTLRADDLANAITGNAGDDNLAAQSGDDTLYGGAGSDSLFGGDGDDLLDGGAGADMFNGIAGIAGIAGIDRVTYASATTAVRAGLTTATVGTGDAAGDTLTAIMGLIGSAFNDTLVGDAGNNALTGSAGLDSLSGGTGLDSLYGGADNDRMFGEDGDDVLSAGDANDYGSGGIGNDALFGGAGTDTLLGDDGDDLLDGGAGADQFFGGAGDDRVTYASATAAVRVDLTTPGNNTGDAAGDVYGSIQSLTGSDFNDSLLGDAVSNTLSGSNGIDSLSGAAGLDSLYGGDGNDQLFGGNDADVLSASDGNDYGSGGIGNDALYGGAGTDTLLGDDGDDILYGGGGADEFRGGTGANIVSYATAIGAVLADLTFGANNLGDADGDTYTNIQSLIGSDFNDTLVGDAGHNSLTGSAGIDSLSGAAGNDSLFGGEDSDRLFGEDGSDTLYGGVGADTLHGGDGDDAFVLDNVADRVVETATGGTDRATASFSIDMNGQAGAYANVENVTLTGTDDLVLYSTVSANMLQGNDGNNVLSGREGNDTLYGGHGADTLHGGIGDDVLNGGAGADVFYGGSGDDRVTYASATGAVLANLSAPSNNTGDANGDTYFDIQHLMGSDFNDSLRGDTGHNMLFGGSAGDDLAGGAGLDSLYGGADNDKLFGEDGDDVLSGGDGNDSGSGGNGNDLLYGGLGNDTLLGDVGNDVLDGGAGADQFFGGTGDDRVTYATATAAVRVDLTTPGSNTGDAAGDTYSGIQSLIGSDFNDTLMGSATANVLSGGSGLDSLSGGAGLDSLYGGDGNDQLFGGDDADVLSAGDGNDYSSAGAGNDGVFGGLGIDTIYGGDGDDTMDGGAGADVFFGGIGTDRVSYASATAAVLANLFDESNNSGDAANDAFNGIQNLMGSDFNDSLRGDTGHNMLFGGSGGDDLAGGAGQDSLYGGDGNDKLYGQSGDDTLSGGNGADTFQFAMGSEQERISDFADNIDRIELFGINGITNHVQAMNAATQVNGDVKFDFGGGNVLWVIGITLAALDNDVFVTI
jgi:Ca2+-binding RTX toxin-like protein